MVEKLAREYRLQERCQNESLCNWRNLFWGMILALFRVDITSKVAIDKVYQVYSRGTS